MADVPILETTGGKPVEVIPADSDSINSQFRQVMDDDGTDTQAPPKRQPKTPAEDKPKPRSRAEKSRTVKESAPVKDDYTEDARNLVGSVWTVAASIAYTQPYALVLESNSDALVGALAEGAKQNATIRSFVASGKSSWMLTLASVGLNMGMQAYQIACDPELQAQARALTVEHLKAAIGANSIKEESDGSPVPAAA